MGGDPGPWEVVNDYNKTVISISAAFLALTGTFTTSEHLAKGPESWLFASWGLLTLSIASALFSVGRLRGALAGKDRSATLCLFAANVSYFALFAAVVAFLLFAMAAFRATPDSKLLKAPTKQAEVIGLRESSARLPSFRGGSASSPEKEILDAVCNVRQEFKRAKVTVAFVAGRYDRRVLSIFAKRTYASNVGLAQQRAETVRDLMASTSVCGRTVDAINSFAFVNGPALTDATKLGSNSSDLVLAEDRRVRVYGLSMEAPVERVGASLERP